MPASAFGPLHGTKTTPPPSVTNFVRRNVSRAGSRSPFRAAPAPPQYSAPVGYPENVLAKDEHVVLHRHPHWGRLTVPALLLIVASAAAAIGQPIIGLSTTLGAGTQLVQVALHLTNAGMVLLNSADPALTALLANPLGGANQAGMTPAQFAPLHAALVQANGEIAQAARLSAGIDLAQLNGLLGSKASTLLAKLPQIALIVDQVTRLTNDAPALLGLGAPTNYLILAMDRSELRTGGGFIGNFGVLPVSGGHIGKLTLEDSYLLDADFYKKTHQQAPAQYPWWPYRNGSAIYGWGLRDSALSADFPTNAAAALSVVQQVGKSPHFEGAAPIDGVVAITSVVMAQVIAIGGGTLTIPEFPTHAVTPQNLEETIHCFQLGACRNEKPFLQSGDTTTTDRKRFTAYLGQALIDRVRHFSATQIKSLVQQIWQDIAAKDIQIFLVPPAAEAVLVEMQSAATIPPHPGDTFLVTDTNIGGNKANSYVTLQETDVVTLLPAGGALHHLLIRTTYQRQGPLYEGSTGQVEYWAYRRVYFPANARSVNISGYLGGPLRTVDLDLTSDLPDRGMVGATIAIGDGTAYNQCKAPDPHSPAWNCAPQVRDTFVTWYTPNAWTTTSHGQRYALLVQRQPGSVATLTVQIDATHLQDQAGAAALISAANQNYDRPSATAPTGFLAATNANWESLVAHTTTIFNGPLSQDEALTWSA